MRSYHIMYHTTSGLFCHDNAVISLVRIPGPLLVTSYYDAVTPDDGYIYFTVVHGITIYK